MSNVDLDAPPMPPIYDWSVFSTKQTVAKRLLYVCSDQIAELKCGERGGFYGGSCSSMEEKRGVLFRDDGIKVDEEGVSREVGVRVQDEIPEIEEGGGLKEGKSKDKKWEKRGGKGSKKGKKNRKKYKEESKKGEKESIKGEKDSIKGRKKSKKGDKVKTEGEEDNKIGEKQQELKKKRKYKEKKGELESEQEGSKLSWVRK